MWDRKIMPQAVYMGDAIDGRTVTYYTFLRGPIFSDHFRVLGLGREVQVRGRLRITFFTQIVGLTTRARSEK